MKNLAGLVALAHLCILPSLFGISFDSGSPQVEELDDLYTERGLSCPLTSFPVSDRELLATAERLQEDADDDQRAAVDELVGELSGKPGEYGLFYKAKTTVDADSSRSGSASNDFGKGLKDYLGREPFLYCGLGVDRPLRGFAYIDIEARKRFYRTDQDLSVPVDGDAGGLRWEVEDHDVKRGVIAFFQDDFDLWIGRDQNRYGPSKSSLICDPSVPYLDSIRFEYYAGPFTLSYRLSTLDDRQAVSDVTPVQPYAFTQNTILNVVHRFQYSSPRFEVAVTGEQFVVRPQNSFQVADVLPVISWHNADITPNNMSLILDASGTPLPGLRLAAQVGFDDIDGNALGIHDDDTPTIDAEIVSMSIPRFLGLYLELGHTHYLWGSFDDDVAMARAIYRVPLMGGTQAIPMTSPYGPGSVWLRVDGARKFGDGFSVGGSVAAVGKKKGDDLFDTDYARSTKLASAHYAFQDIVAVPVAYDRDHWRLSIIPGAKVESLNVYPSIEISSSYALD